MALTQWLAGIDDANLVGVIAACLVALLLLWRLLNVLLKVVHREGALTQSRDAFSRYTSYLRF